MARRQRAVPRATTFIAGNHEDFDFLAKHHQRDVLPGLHFLPSGGSRETVGGLRVAGIGGCYGPTDYEVPTRKLQGGARRHYTREQAEQAGRDGRVDILLLHDAPAGTKLQGKGARRAHARHKHYRCSACSFAPFGAKPHRGASR